MEKPDYIVSDLHLGAVPKATERDFIRFLEMVRTDAASLIINGDLFDFWFEWGPVIPSRHFRVLAALADVVEAGVPVTMIGGNHDAWGGRFLSEEVGMRMHDGVLRTTLGGKPALIAHGDGLGKGDYKYRFLKSVLRSKPAIWGFRALHPELGVRLAGGVSRTEDRAHMDHRNSGRMEFLEEWGRSELAADPSLRLVTCGHSHVPHFVEVEPGRYYINSGDWVGHRTYITVATGQPPVLREYENMG